MIPKARVTQIGLKRGSRSYVVAGYEGKLGFYPAHRQRQYTTYANACKYAIELRDYYQAQIVEF